jgi:GPI mannosyltransferase 1 subunit M
MHVDMLVGWLLLRITPANHSTIVYASWLFNPLAMAISARGNAESIIACLVLLSVYLVLTGRIMWGAIMHGIAVHFKIYPVIYSVAFLSYMTSRSRSGLLDLISWSGIKFGIVSALTFQLLTGICYNAYIHSCIHYYIFL